MEKTITIGDKDVKLKSSGAIPHIYRRLFQQDLLVGMGNMEKRIKKNTIDLSAEDMQLLEQLTYTLAKHADPQSVPDDIEMWMGEFELMDIINAFPEVLSLWNQENASTSNLKKKAGQ